MGYSSPTILPGSGSPDPLNALVPLILPEPTPPRAASDAISILRQSLTGGMRSPAAILHASTDAARALTGADGVAIAVRTKGVVVCRARSGDLAPELGSLVNADYGISGECLRSATIMLCDDATTDDRVDPEVCRALGIRSIVAVPLRGPAGIAGILEAFSSSPSAFGHAQIDALRELAEIAEVAYERECQARDAAAISVKSATRRQLFSALVKEKIVLRQNLSSESLAGEILGERSPRRRYWILGAAAFALLLISAVVWLSWRDPTPDVAASESGAKSVSAAESSTTPVPIRVEPKPAAGITSHKSTPLRTTVVLRNAAAIELDAGATSVSQSETPADKDVGSTPLISASEAPPPLQLAVSSEPTVLSSMTAESAAMPTLAAKISQGIKQGSLLNGVQAVYPPQARVQRLSGSVVVDATIGEDGTVRSVKIISGTPLLAVAASDAIRQWRYSPSLLNGAPIEVQKRITVVFKLP